MSSDQYTLDKPIPGYQCQMAFIATTAITNAAKSQDPTYRSNFAGNMAKVLAVPGFGLMPFQYIPFGEFTRQPELEFDHVFSRVASGDVSDEALFSFKCAGCKAASYTLAALIVAGGAAALTILTEGSDIVVGLASFGGVSTSAALAFAKGLGGAIASGVSAVVKAICGWVGLC